MRFGEFLYENNLLSAEELLDALSVHWSNGVTMGAAMCRRGFLSRNQIEKRAGMFHGIELGDVVG